MKESMIILDLIIRPEMRLENIFAKAENGFGCVCTHTGIAAISVLFETVLKKMETLFW